MENVALSFREQPPRPEFGIDRVRVAESLVKEDQLMATYGYFFGDDIHAARVTTKGRKSMVVHSWVEFMREVAKGELVSVSSVPKKQ